MRIAVAQIVQETCSFTPAPTTLERFRDAGLREGQDVVDGIGGSSALGGFLTAIRKGHADHRIVPLLDATAVAGGPLTAETLHYLSEHLLTNLRSADSFDAIYLSLHGAAAAEGEPDVEGHILEAVRAVAGPRIPLIASFDHHGNITQRMLDHLDGLVAHRNQPHDPPQTGSLAAQQLLAIVEGRLKPTIAWRRVPMLAHQEQFATNRGPMHEWFDAARRAEETPGIASVSLFPLQPWLDVPEAGWSAVVVSDGDQPLAEEVAERLAQQAWSLRERFWAYESVPIDEATRGVAAAEHGVVLLADVGDSVLGGAPGDSPHILRALLRQNVGGPALVPIVDPSAVDAAIAAGIGASIVVELGGSMAQAFHRPVTVSGDVAAIKSGPIQADVAGFSAFDMGRTVLLDCDRVKIVVSEREGIGGIHPVVYERCGLRPDEARAIVVKTAANFQHYDAMRSRVIRVDSPGPTTSHLERLPWRHIPRPIYPLDDTGPHMRER